VQLTGLFNKGNTILIRDYRATGFLAWAVIVTFAVPVPDDHDD